MRSWFSTVLLASATSLLAGSLSVATAAAASASPATTSAATRAAATAKVGESAVKARHPQAIQLPAPVSQTPVGWTPDITGSGSCGSLCGNGTVYSTVVVGSEVVVAGAFSQVCAPAPQSYAQCPNAVNAGYIFAYNIGTGAIDPNFNPGLNTGPVYALAAGPNNTVYAGGAFTAVNGTGAPGLAQLSVTPGQPSTDGQLVSGFAGQTTGIVNALAVQGNALYVGGTFTKVDGTNQRGIARLDATSGALDTSFKITISSPTSGAALGVKTLSVTPDGNVLAIGGSFLQVNGTSTPRVALINTGGSLGATATLDNWSAPILANNCSKQHDYVNGLDFSPDGSFFVIATTGYRSGGGPAICDAAARFETAATGTSVQPTWINYSGGDSYHTAAVSGSVVYLGGHNRWANNECGNNHVCEANAVLENGLSAVDANTGLALPWWHPQTSRGVGVRSLTVFGPGTYPGSNGGLIVGTDVSIIGGATHDKLAMFPLTTTTTQAAGGPIQSGMFSQGRIGGLDESNTGTAAMCVDDANNSSASGSPAVLSTCQNDNEQNWTVQSGTIQVNGLCLDTSGGGTGDGTPAVLDTCTGSSSQTWTQGTGNTLVNGTSGRCLDDPGASTSNGTQLQIWDCDGSIQQVWPLPVAQAPPPPPPSGPIFSALDQSSTQVPCLDDQSNRTKAGSVVDFQTCYGYSSENWTVESNGTIQIHGVCLDTASGGTTNGTPVVLDPCNGKASQVWTPSGYYALVNQASGLCLTDPGSNTANGTQMQIQTCSTGATNQQWRLPTY